MYFLFDIGGTKMRFAISDDGETFSTTKIMPTPENISDVIGEFKKVTDELLGSKVPTAVAGGITRKKIAAAEGIEKLFTCPVYLENDAALAGLGEAKLVDKNIVVYVTVSTGVGGVQIVDGKIAPHLTSFEPGYQIIDFNQPEKRLEDYVSGAAVQKIRGQEPKDVHDEVFWQSLAKILAIGLHNTILHWTPEVLILGGSMMKEPGIDIAEVEKHLKQSLSFLDVLPVLKLAELGDLGGLHGALAFLKQKSVS